MVAFVSLGAGARNTVCGVGWLPSCAPVSRHSAGRKSDHDLPAVIFLAALDSKAGESIRLTTTRRRCSA